MPSCYAFETKSIQSYILDSGKLADMVGASELIASLTVSSEMIVSLTISPLDKALEALGISEDVSFSRRAGGAFIALFDDLKDAEALRDLWSLIVPQYAPGLEFVHAAAEAASHRAAAKEALEQMQYTRIPMPDIPAGTPLTRYNPRNGLPAKEFDGSVAGGGQWLDIGTIRKREFKQGTVLSGRFLPVDVDAKWPINMEEEFPFDSDNRYVGIIHADGNGLGVLLRQLQNVATDENYVELHKGFSDKLGEATEAAAKHATEKVLLPKEDNKFLPARPLVLGGDDLAIIVRGDLAIPFAEAFLEAFEEKTKHVVEHLRHYEKWPFESLTACAGVAFVKANQPFYMAYRLAEELCGQAKQQSDRVASALSFHRITTSFIPDMNWIMEREMTAHAKDQSVINTLGSYGVGGVDSKLPRLDDLKSLKKILSETGEHAGSSRMRQLLSLFNESPAEAKKMYARWRDLMGDKQKGEPEALQKFDTCLKKLLGEEIDDKELPGREQEAGGSNVIETPLGDLLAWLAVETGSGGVGDE